MTTQATDNGSDDLHRRKTEPVENYSEATSTQLDTLFSDGLCGHCGCLTNHGNHCGNCGNEIPSAVFTRKQLLAWADTLAKEVIGADEPYIENPNQRQEYHNDRVASRRLLRDEQRRRLSQLLNRGGDGVAIDKSDVPTEVKQDKGEHSA